LGDMFDKDSEWEFVTDDLFEKYGLFFIIRNIVRNAAS